jgi:predicted ArsR family transcriptional regulator
MVKNGYKSDFFLLELTRDLFDERVLATLRDSKPKDFTMLLDEVGFSHNTLQQHLERLTTRGLVVREKIARNGFGRPKFAYHVPSRTTKQVNAALEDMQLELVAIASSRLRPVCRFERGATAKKQRRTVSLKFAPNQKIRLITSLHQ